MGGLWWHFPGETGGLPGHRPSLFSTWARFTRQSYGSQRCFVVWTPVMVPGCGLVLTCGNADGAQKRVLYVDKCITNDRVAPSWTLVRNANEEYDE